MKALKNIYSMTYLTILCHGLLIAWIMLVAFFSISFNSLNTRIQAIEEYHNACKTKNVVEYDAQSNILLHQ